MPLGGYAILLAAYGATFGSFLRYASKTRQPLPEPTWRDLVLFGVATHKLTRIVTHDWVTAPLRAPFVRYEGSDGAGEVSESSRGTGLRRAIGDLVTCAFCTGPWIAGAMWAASAVAPKPTRFVAGVLTTVAVSDFAHQAYSAIRAKTQELKSAAQT